MMNGLNRLVSPEGVIITNHWEVVAAAQKLYLKGWRIRLPVGSGCPLCLVRTGFSGVVLETFFRSDEYSDQEIWKSEDGKSPDPSLWPPDTSDAVISALQGMTDRIRGEDN